MSIIRPLFHAQANLRFGDSRVEVMIRNRERTRTRCINKDARGFLRLENFAFVRLKDKREALSVTSNNSTP